MYDGLPEKLLRKSDVDLVFSVTKPLWAKTASGMIAPGWTVRLAEHDTGAEVIGLSPSSDASLSIQPFFVNDTSKPELVVIGNVLPPGTFAPITASMKKEMEALTQQEIGATYSVTLKHKINVQQQTVIEFWLTKGTGSATLEAEGNKGVISNAHSVYNKF